MFRGSGKRFACSSSSSRAISSSSRALSSSSRAISSGSRAISSDHRISNLDKLMEHTESDETQPRSPPRQHRRVVERHDDHIKYAPDGRVILYLSDSRLLCPTAKVRGAATDSFQTKAEPTGYNWKSVSNDMKEFYWGELQKKCCWNENELETAVVREKWEKSTALAYKDWISGIKRKYEKGHRHKIKGVLPQVLDAWIVHWEKPEVKAKSEQASRNRRSGPDGPGTGPVIHHGGSRNAKLHAMDLAKSQNIDFHCTGLATQELLHCVDGVWTDSRAKSIYDEVMRRASEERAPLLGSNEERVVTVERVEEIYREMIKPDKKGRVLGKGCLSQLYVTRLSRGGQFSGTPLPTQHEANIRELEDRLKAQHEEMEARMKAQKEEHAREFGQLQQNMKRMMDYLSQSFSFDSFTSLHPPPPLPPPR